MFETTGIKLVDKQSRQSTCIKPVDNLQWTCYYQARASDANASWYRPDYFIPTSLEQTCGNLRVSGCFVLTCNYTLPSQRKAPMHGLHWSLITKLKSLKPSSEISLLPFCPGISKFKESAFRYKIKHTLYAPTFKKRHLKNVITKLVRMYSNTVLKQLHN